MFPHGSGVLKKAGATVKPSKFRFADAIGTNGTAFDMQCARCSCAAAWVSTATTPRCSKTNGARCTELTRHVTLRVESMAQTLHAAGSLVRRHSIPFFAISSSLRR